MLTILFYSFALIFMIKELQTILDPTHTAFVIDQILKSRRKNELKTQQMWSMFIEVVYFTWVCAGFFSSQRILFIGIMALSIAAYVVRNKASTRLKIRTHWWDSFLSFLTLAFMIANKLFLHIKLI